MGSGDARERRAWRLLEHVTALVPQAGVAALRRELAQAEAAGRDAERRAIVEWLRASALAELGAVQPVSTALQTAAFRVSIGAHDRKGEGSET